MLQLKSYFPDYINSGAIFSKMTMAPWVDVTSGLDMDILYLSMYSGVKNASSFVTDFTVNGVADSVKLANLIWNMYGPQWRRLWDAYILEYNPINDYSIKEDIIRQGTDNRTIDKKTVDNGSVTQDDDYTTTTTLDDTVESNSKIEYGKIVDTQGRTEQFTFAFNTEATTPVPEANVTDSTVETQSGADVTTGTDTTTGTDITTRKGTNTVTSNDTITDNGTDNLERNETIIRTQTGNIGRNSYQELIRQEFELWKWNFYEQIFRDCDRILTLSIIDNCNHTCSLVN